MDSSRFLVTRNDLRARLELRQRFVGVSLPADCCLRDGQDLECLEFLIAIPRVDQRELRLRQGSGWLPLPEQHPGQPNPRRGSLRRRESRHARCAIPEVDHGLASSVDRGEEAGADEAEKLIEWPSRSGKLLVHRLRIGPAMLQYRNDSPSQPGPEIEWIQRLRLLQGRTRVVETAVRRE